MKTWKLVSGIFTMLFSIFATFSGIVFGIDNAINNRADGGDSAVLLINMFFFMAGLVSICVRKSKIAGNIAIIILYGITALIGFSTGGSQGQWTVVAVWSTICAAIAAISLYKNINESKQPKNTSSSQANIATTSKQCPHCHADVPSGSAFCGSCGKELPKETICPQCGASVDTNAQFCPNCGKNLSEPIAADNVEQTVEYGEDEENPMKKYLPYVLGAIALIAICGGGWWYFNSSKAPQSNNEEAVAEAVDADPVAPEAVEEDFAVDTDIPPMEQALNAYEPILDKYIAKGESNNHWEEYYFLHDVTGDGIPELWLQVDGGDSFRILSFTYKDGNTVQLFNGDLGAPDHIGYHKGNGYIIKTYFSMGYQSWIKYEYKNGEIQENEIYENYYEIDENAEYKEPSEPAISPIEITNKQELYNIVY